MVTSYASNNNLPFEMLKIFAECLCHQRFVRPKTLNRKTIRKERISISDPFLECWACKSAEFAQWSLLQAGNKIWLSFEGLLSCKSRYNEMSTETGFQARTGKGIHMGNDNKILATVITVMLILSALVGIVAAVKDEFKNWSALADFFVGFVTSKPRAFWKKTSKLSDLI